MLGSASYPIFVHRLIVYVPCLPTPHPVALMQLRLRFAGRDQLATGLAPLGNVMFTRVLVGRAGVEPTTNGLKEAAPLKNVV